MSFGLLPASFRGVPFAVTEQTTSVSRRQAVHEYPGRDDVWTEDMGRGATRYGLRGFIVENDPVYAGGPIEAQRLAVYAAAQAAGAGPLTHPTLGLLIVSCESVSISEALDGATFSVIEWRFVEAGSRAFPSLSLSSIGASSGLVTALAFAADAVRVVALSNTGTAGNSTGSLATVSGQWTVQVVTAGADATALSRLAAALPGNLGRYSRGATAGYLASAGQTDITLPQLIDLAATQRADIAAAIVAVGGAVTGLTIITTEQDYADAAAAVLAALTAACADPSDALRLLKGLLAYNPAGIDAGSPAGAAVTVLWRRLIALEIARVAATYQPASYDDAFAQLVAVSVVLDGAITAAANAGQDALFAALRSVRAAVVDDLRARGATLAHVQTFTVPASVPAVTLAQRLYRDAARADELVGEAGPACISPLFMPTSIQALAA